MADAQNVLDSLLYGNGIKPSEAFNLVRNGALQDAESQKKISEILTTYAKQPVTTEQNRFLPKDVNGLYAPDLRAIVLNSANQGKANTLVHEAIHAIDDRIFKAVMADKNAGPEADKFKQLYNDLQKLWGEDQQTVKSVAKTADEKQFADYRIRPNERLAFGANDAFPNAAQDRKGSYMQPEDKNALDAVMQLLKAVPEKYLRTPRQMMKD